MSNFKVYNPLQAVHLDTGGPGSYFLRSTGLLVDLFVGHREKLRRFNPDTEQTRYPNRLTA